MRFDRIKIHNFGPFADLSVNFAELPGPLVAVCGENGAGKSTLLELLLGAISRQCPTRGPLTGLATARDSSVELSVWTGSKSYTIRQSVDSVSGKSEATISNGAGTPLVPSTKVRDVGAYIEKHFPPLDVVLVSTFAAQKSGGFIDRKPSERKSLLLQILRVDHLEELATEARRRSGVAERTCVELHAKQKAIRESAADPEAAAVDVESLTRLLEKQTDELAAAREKTAETRKAEAEYAAVAEKQDGWRRTRKRLDDERSRLELALADITTRAANNRKLTERRAAIEAAVEETARFEAEHKALTEERGALALSLSLFESKATLRWRELTRLESAAAQLSLVTARRAQVDDAIAEVASLGPEIAELEKTAEQLEADLALLRELGAANRIDALRVGFDAVLAVDHVPEIHRIATERLSQDDQAASAATEIPDRELQVKAAKHKLAGARAAHARASTRAAGDAEVTRAQAELSAAHAEIAIHNQAKLAAEAEHSALRFRTAANAKAIVQNTAATAGLAELVKLAGKLDAAAERIAELETQTRDTEAQLQVANEALVELGAMPVAVFPLVSVSTRELRERELDGQIAETTRARARAEQVAEQAASAAARLAELAAARVLADREVAEWVLLATDLGKDGLQAALVDAALPELVALTNSLLHSAFGPRFTVDVRSQSLDSKGKRLLETLDVIVLDSEKGREAPVESYSGGEQAIIGEGISLALTTLAAREAGLSNPTIVRDEAGAALDPAHGRQWIAMLRQAVSLIGADRLLFVSHSAELSELADSRVQL